MTTQTELSPRQKEVLRHFLGQTTKIVDVAKQLELNQRTVRQYAEKAMMFMQARHDYPFDKGSGLAGFRNAAQFAQEKGLL